MKPLVFQGVIGVLFLALAGCGSDYVGSTVPVKGKVMVNGKPADHGSVAFFPDAGKGSTAKYEAGGQIGPDGTYTLMTRDKPGAATGAYKVTVSIQTKPDNINPTKVESEVPTKYTSKDTTPLNIEVVASPAAGAYDLDIK